MRNCETMSEVRKEIDRMDREIVALLAERLEYIRQAGHIKQSRDVIRDEDRIEDVVAKVKASARSHNSDEALVEDVYRLLIERSIAYEFDVFDAQVDGVAARAIA